MKQETWRLSLALLLTGSERYQSLTSRPRCSHLWNGGWGQGPRRTALGRPSHTSQRFSPCPWTSVCPAVGHRGQNHGEFWKAALSAPGIS